MEGPLVAWPMEFLVKHLRFKAEKAFGSILTVEVLGKMAILTFAMCVCEQVMLLLDSWWLKIGKLFIIISYVIFFIY
jgi:hypothetical protein